MKLFINGGAGGSDAAGSYVRLREAVEPGRPVLYIPFAKEDEEDRRAGYEKVKKDLSLLNTDIETVGTGRELGKKYLGAYGCVYIADGNTFRLADELKSSGGFEMLLGYARMGGVLYGEGAGAVLLGADVEGAVNFDANDAGLSDTSGLDLLGGASVFPHYRAINMQQQRFLGDYSAGRIVFAVPNGSAVYLNGREYELLGTKSVYQFVNGKKTLL